METGMKDIEILDRTIFVGGPPRSGTTFAAKSLNLHPAIVTAIDDHVYECWGLYYYRDRVGLVQDLRTRQLTPEEVKESLKNHLIVENRLIGAAPSVKTAGCPQVAKIESLFPGSVRSVLDKDLGRYTIPLEQFSNDWRLCLKSPEISFVLPQLASHFPASRFVLVYRPISEIAESMYRIGNMVKRFPVFHKRWFEEMNESGELIPPPGVPAEWNNHWQKASDFQRCVIYAAAYIHGMLEGVGHLSLDRYLIYNHAHLRNSPDKIHQRLADFLKIDASGFKPAVTQLKTGLPSIHPKLTEEYLEIEAELTLKMMMNQIETLATDEGKKERR
jgi:hypothetical protein